MTSKKNKKKIKKLEKRVKKLESNITLIQTANAGITFILTNFIGIYDKNMELIQKTFEAIADRLSIIIPNTEKEIIIKDVEENEPRSNPVEETDSDSSPD